MPQHVIGYRVNPFSWEELRDIVDQDDLSYLSRSVMQQYEYEIYKIHSNKTWHSVYDHIMCSKFGAPSVLIEESGLQKANLDNLDKLPTLALLPNEFPYFVEEPIQHWVLWKLGSSCTDDDIEWAKTELQERIGPIHDFLYWTNPPHLRSVMEIDHAHILCLPEQGE